MECPRFSKETLKRLGWSHSGSESGWYFWELLQVALGVYVYAGHSGPACWFAANLTSSKMHRRTAVNCPPSPPIPLFLLKDLVKSCFYTHTIDSDDFGIRKSNKNVTIETKVWSKASSCAALFAK